MVRALAQVLNGLRFDSLTRAHTWVAGQIPGPSQSLFQRQPISLFLSPPFLPSTLSKNQGKKYPQMRINKRKQNIFHNGMNIFNLQVKCAMYMYPTVYMKYKQFTTYTNIYLIFWEIKKEVIIWVWQFIQGHTEVRAEINILVYHKPPGEILLTIWQKDFLFVLLYIK